MICFDICPAFILRIFWSVDFSSFFGPETALESMVKPQGTACEGPAPPPGARLLWRVNPPSPPRPSGFFFGNSPRKSGAGSVFPRNFRHGEPFPLRRPSREKSASEGS
ncbi:Hypothetical protein FKW44_022939 [Caligus rogercresseyi]|uniref:Uncharacterized protein n=1 Tax=Caligus rogercresseyi TaxID=217165 RepID=A0A7T8GN63_CALRO|nr:Hypothetical protein FKW44_022939 [Caligus rogercresseyi]